jgi:predicted transcriptional regulator|nr:MAG TPA: HTH-type transcriptional regulator [Caudoviricetes sp.]
MIMTQEKTYSVLEAAKKLELSRAIVSRLCQRGLVGKRYDFPEFSQHVYRLTEDDLEVLRARKNDWTEKLKKRA